MLGHRLRRLPGINPSSAGIEFRRQNLTSRRHILTSKVDPRTKRVKYLYWPQTHNTGIQMKQKELTKIFIIISNLKKTLVSMVYPKLYQRCKGLNNHRLTGLRLLLAHVYICRMWLPHRFFPD